MYFVIYFCLLNSICNFIWIFLVILLCLLLIFSFLKLCRELYFPYVLNDWCIFLFSRCVQKTVEYAKRMLMVIILNRWCVLCLALCGLCGDKGRYVTCRTINQLLGKSPDSFSVLLTITWFEFKRPTPSHFSHENSTWSDLA